MTYGAALTALTARRRPPPPRPSVTIPEGRSIARGGRRAAPAAGLEGDYPAATRRSRVLDPRRYGAPEGTQLARGLPVPRDLRAQARRDRRDARRRAAAAPSSSNFASVDLRARPRARTSRRYDVLIDRLDDRARGRRSPSDRRLIAAVIYNRLKRGIPLGIDATLRYALSNWTRPLKAVRARSATRRTTRAAPGPAADADRQPGPRLDPGGGATRRNVAYLYYVVKPCAPARTPSRDRRAVPARRRGLQRKRAQLGGKDPSHCCKRPAMRRLGVARLARRPLPLAGDAQRRARRAGPARLALPAPAASRPSCSPRRCARCPAPGFVGRQRHDPAQARRRSRSPTTRRPPRRAIGAANTLTFADGRITPRTPTRPACSPRCRGRRAGARALVLGAGGSARAAVWALREAGADVAVLNRTAERARGARRRPRRPAVDAAEPGRPARQLHVGRAGSRPEDVQGSARLPPRSSTRSACVVDLVYRAGGDTALIAAARRAGLRGRRRARGPGPPGRAELRALDRRGRAARGDAHGRTPGRPAPTRHEHATPRTCAPCRPPARPTAAAAALAGREDGRRPAGVTPPRSRRRRGAS